MLRDQKIMTQWPAPQDDGGLKSMQEYYAMVAADAQRQRRLNSELQVALRWALAYVEDEYMTSTGMVLNADELIKYEVFRKLVKP